MGRPALLPLEISLQVLYNKTYYIRLEVGKSEEAYMVEIKDSLCVRCGLCADNCAVHALRPDENGALRCRELLCFRCGQCVAICPTGAASMPDAEAPIEYDKDKFAISPENLLNTMRFRRSIRRFTGEKVTRRELEALLEAGRCAPTSTNSQTVQFVVLDQEFEALRPRIWASLARGAAEKGRRSLVKRYEQYLAHPEEPDALFYGASQMIAVTSARPVDGALALANMELLAHTMGLGALYCGFAASAISADPALREYFGITDTRHLDSCLIVGRTKLIFHRTAPRNPANVEWR